MFIRSLMFIASLSGLIVMTVAHESGAINTVQGLVLGLFFGAALAYSHIIEC